MLKATFAITVPRFCSHLYLRFLQKAIHTSFNIILSRFCIHETLQINQSNFLIFNPVFIRVSRNHIVHACR
jgi:hypothetical protein